MRILVRIIAMMLLTIGVIWMLQGFNILPGSFMTGQMQWAGFGALSVVVGGVLLWWSSRLR
ncbi:MAG: hypothetical protein ABW278_14175 [Steroidobacteraceae bacterium]